MNEGELEGVKRLSRRRGGLRMERGASEEEDEGEEEENEKDTVLHFEEFLKFSFNVILSFCSRRKKTFLYDIKLSLLSRGAELQTRHLIIE